MIMSERTPSPLFVVGVQRSGTTWVANALCNHPRIFGIQSPKYYGIKESSFFSHLDGRFGDISLAGNYRDFLETFTQTTYFNLSGVTKEELQDLCPKSYAGFFANFMAMVATTHSSSREPPKYWLEKTPTHTLYLRKIIASYPGAKVVGTERGLEDVIRSSKRLRQRRLGVEDLPFTFLFRAVFHWCKYRSYLRHFTNSYPHKFFVLSYNELIKKTEEHFKDICSFLNLAWEETLLENKFERNTSFRHSRRSEALSESEKQLVHFLGALLGNLPYSTFKLHEMARQPRNSKNLDFMFR